MEIDFGEACSKFIFAQLTYLCDVQYQSFTLPALSLRSYQNSQKTKLCKFDEI